MRSAQVLKTTAKYCKAVQHQQVLLLATPGCDLVVALPLDKELAELLSTTGHVHVAAASRLPALRRLTPLPISLILGQSTGTRPIVNTVCWPPDSPQLAQGSCDELVQQLRYCIAIKTKAQQLPPEI